MKRIFIFALTVIATSTALAAETPKAEPKKQDRAAASVSSTRRRPVANVGTCSSIAADALQEYDHACQGTWMATRKGEAIMFCCAQENN